MTNTLLPQHTLPSRIIAAIGTTDPIAGLDRALPAPAVTPFGTTSIRTGMSGEMTAGISRATLGAIAPCPQDREVAARASHLGSEADGIGLPSEAVVAMTIPRLCRLNPALSD